MAQQVTAGVVCAATTRRPSRSSRQWPGRLAGLMTAVCAGCAVRGAAGFAMGSSATLGSARGGAARGAAGVARHESLSFAAAAGRLLVRRRAVASLAAMTMVATESAAAKVATRHAAARAGTDSNRQATAARDGFLPWEQSVAGPEHPLLYMPFLEASLAELMAKLELAPTPTDADLALQLSQHPNKPGRIATLVFNGPLIRKARLTYLDAGPAVQVFNMVLYPDASMDAPILGVDLISFGKKQLAGIDFQPLHSDPEYAARYVDRLAPLKARYPDLAQQMSARFYDSAQFFSPHMLFARFEDRSLVTSQLLPAFSDYLTSYLHMLSTAPRVATPAARAAVLERHTAYDQYNAERDPAHPLFVQYFGHDWAERFMDDVLFELSTRPEGGYPKVSHGPPQGQQAQQQQGAATA